MKYFAFLFRFYQVVMQATRITGFWESKLPNLTPVLAPHPVRLLCPRAPVGEWLWQIPQRSVQSCFLHFRDRVSTISYGRSGPSLSSLTFTAGRLRSLGILGWEMGPADLHGETYQASGKDPNACIPRRHLRSHRQ